MAAERKGGHVGDRLPRAYCCVYQVHEKIFMWESRNKAETTRRHSCYWVTTSQQGALLLVLYTVTQAFSFESAQQSFLLIVYTYQQHCQPFGGQSRERNYGRRNYGRRWIPLFARLPK